MGADTAVPEPKTVDSAGAQLAAALVESLVLLNKSVSILTKVIKRQAVINDDLTARFEAFGNAMDMLAELSQTKKSLTFSDFAQALATANAQIFGEDDGLSEDEEQEEDPD